MRRLASATVAAALVAVALPAVAAPAKPARFRMWRITRTVTRAVPLSAKLTFAFDASPNSLLVFGLRGSGQKRTANATAGGYSELGTIYPSVYGVNGQDASLCPTAPGCGTALGLDQTVGLDSGGAVRDTYFVVVEHGRVMVDFDTPHWKAREVPATRVQKIVADDTSATGIHAGTRIERYTGTTAKGGRYGSIAYSFIPCDNAGVGTADLSTSPRSPWQPAAMSCGLRTAGAYANADAPGPVTWNVKGEATGTTDHSTRLFVVDFPKT